ncbi:MAG: OadG family protein [Candidatus Cryptobacteroides sp.]
MGNFGTGLQLMLVGMITVFVILLIVIYGSRLLIKLINRIAPEQEQKKAPAGEDYSAVFEAVVAQLTQGKGKLTKITKL